MRFHEALGYDTPASREAVGDGCWKVYFGPVELGLIDPRRASPLRNRRLFSVLVRLDGTRPRFYGRAVKRA